VLANDLESAGAIFGLQNPEFFTERDAEQAANDSVVVNNEDGVHGEVLVKEVV
jgi:hypothetical protein